MNIKKTLTFFFAIITVGFLVGCGGKGEVIDFSKSLKQKTEIRVWIDDEAGEYMQDIIDAFNVVHPDIYVRHQHMGSVDAREKLKTFGPSGNGADVFQFPHDHLAAAIREDLVYALDTATKDRVSARAHELGVSIATLCYNESSKKFTCDGQSTEKLYAVPMSLESLGLYYNKALVTTPVTTFEQLLTEADAWNAKVGTNGLTNAANGDYYLGSTAKYSDSYFMQFVFSAFGFRPFGENGDNPTSVGFTNDSMRNALKWMVEELKPRTTGTGDPESGANGARFEAGKTPYIIAGPWNIEGFKKNKIDFDVVDIPTIKGQQTKTYAGSIMAAVYKYSNKKDAAQKFVEFLNSDEAMEIQYRHKGKLPALKTELLSNIEGVTADKALMAMSKQLKSSIPMPTIPEIQHYWGPAETMITEVWNSGVTLINQSVTDAEASYNSNKDK